MTSPFDPRFAPVPFPRDEPPPGYTDFYGWHQGVFHGFTVTDPVQLAKFREEGRWFDKFGREIPRWKSDGEYNLNGGALFQVDHPDPYQASKPQDTAILQFAGGIALLLGGLWVGGFAIYFAVGFIIHLIAG